MTTDSGSLGSSLDKFTVLLQLRAHAHIAELVPDGHDHATDDGGVHCVGDQSLLVPLQESLQSSLDLLQHGSVQGLGCGDLADNLSSVGGHEG